MAEHWNGGNGGKGSKPRPYSVDRETYENNWDKIFGKNKLADKVVQQVEESIKNNTGTDKNEYQDVVSTEDCSIDALEEYKKQAQELWNDSCTSQRSKK